MAQPGVSPAYIADVLEELRRLEHDEALRLACVIVLFPIDGSSKVPRILLAHDQHLVEKLGHAASGRGLPIGFFGEDEAGRRFTLPLRRFVGDVEVEGHLHEFMALSREAALADGEDVGNIQIGGGWFWYELK